MRFLPCPVVTWKKSHIYVEVFPSVRIIINGCQHRNLNRNHVYNYVESQPETQIRETQKSRDSAEINMERSH